MGVNPSISAMRGFVLGTCFFIPRMSFDQFGMNGLIHRHSAESRNPVTGIVRTGTERMSVFPTSIIPVFFSLRTLRENSFLLTPSLSPQSSVLSLTLRRGTMPGDFSPRPFMGEGAVRRVRASRYSALSPVLSFSPRFRAVHSAGARSVRQMFRAARWNCCSRSPGLNGGPFLPGEAARP